MTDKFYVKYKKYKLKYIKLKKQLGGNYSCNPKEELLSKFCKKNDGGKYKTINECIDDCIDIKRIQKFLPKIEGQEYILYPNDDIIFFHYSPTKFLYPNKIANWISIMKTRPLPDPILNKYAVDEPFWEADEGNFNYIYKLKKPIKFLVFPNSNTLRNNTSEFIKQYDQFKNTNKYREFIKDHNVDYDDYEYEFAYYMCNFTEFRGWMTNSNQYGLFILCGNTQDILELQKVETYEQKRKIIYTPNEWKIELGL
jgi:hypothetical protein